MLQGLINADRGDYRGRTIPGDKGESYEFIGYRDKKVLTVLGPVTVKRAYYYDGEGQRGFARKIAPLTLWGPLTVRGLVG